jgi:hypothetical protein
MELVADRHSGGRVEIKVDLAVCCHSLLNRAKRSRDVAAYIGIDRFYSEVSVF